MDAGHPIVAELVAQLVTGEEEAFALPETALLNLQDKLRTLAGNLEFSGALLGLANVAAYLKGAGGSPTAAAQLFDLLRAQAPKVRALRLRHCGTTSREANSLEAFRRFSGTATVLPASKPREARDFRIAFLREREELMSNPYRARAPRRAAKEQA